MIIIKTIITEISKQDKLKGSYIRDDKIFFIFAKNLYNYNSDYEIKQVELIGSFTEWKKRWKLKEFRDGIWLLKKDLAEVNIPGNSGEAEFKFIINQENIISPPKELDLGYKFFDGHGNNFKNIILLDKSKTKKIRAINQEITTYRINYNSNQELANFREITLGNITNNKLYRSYHPFIKSRQDHPLEDKRLATVQQLMIDNNINSIINLSDKREEITNGTKLYHDLIAEENILLTNQTRSYDLFYYISDQEEFTELLNEIVSFIIDPKNQTPFLIHCRIGTDRTGVLTAIIAAFMGANWEEIAADYEASNQLGIKEYRDRELLRYTFEKLVGQSFNNRNLAQLVNQYFESQLDFKQQDLQKLKDKLST